MFRRLAYLAAAALVVTMTLAPDLALARAGSSTSLGSRGTRTYTAPPSTSTAPGTAAPMQRSMTDHRRPETASSDCQQPTFGSQLADAPKDGLLSCAHKSAPAYSGRVTRGLPVALIMCPYCGDQVST